MKFLIFVGSICTLAYGISAETCQSTNDGSACLTAADLPSWMESYSGGKTCFDGWCFMTTGGSMNPCKCFDDNVTYDNEYCDPAVYGDDNTMCLYDTDAAASACGEVIARKIEDTADQDAIVDKHNALRSTVAKGEETQGVGGGQPAAANMRKMVWSDELAEVAQRWADQCISGHDANRQTATFSNVGQNYAMTASSVSGVATDWDYMVQMWYDEVKDFPAANIASYSSTGATGVVGHYTQVVWAESYEVGCGYIYYPNGIWYTKILMCNYGPAGNFLNNAMYIEGDAGTQCPSGTSAGTDGLCG